MRERDWRRHMDSRRSKRSYPDVGWVMQLDVNHAALEVEQPALPVEEVIDETKSSTNADGKAVTFVTAEGDIQPEEDGEVEKIMQKSELKKEAIEGDAEGEKPEEEEEELCSNPRIPIPKFPSPIPKKRLPWTTAYDRLRLDPDNLYVENDLLYCRPCNQIVTHTKKSIVASHLKAKMHLKAIAEAKARADAEEAAAAALERINGPSVKGEPGTSLQEEEKPKGKKKTVYAKMKDELLEDLVDLFVGCNIPIYKLDKPHFRKFLHKHVKNSGCIPTSGQIKSKFSKNGRMPAPTPIPKKPRKKRPRNKTTKTEKFEQPQMIAVSGGPSTITIPISATSVAQSGATASAQPQQQVITIHPNSTILPQQVQQIVVQGHQPGTSTGTTQQIQIQPAGVGQAQTGQIQTTQIAHIDKIDNKEVIIFRTEPAGNYHFMEPSPTTWPAGTRTITYTPQYH